jgi:hypothetical protein
MQKSEITPNTEYALREKREAGAPLQRIRIIQHLRRNKWKAQWIDPNPGLTDYVESSQVICLWKEHKAFLKEEENAERLREYNSLHGYEGDSPIDNAVTQVFESVGEHVQCYRGVLSGAPEAIERVKARANDSSTSEPYTAYRDRKGILHWPFDAAFELARKFCGAEPSTVLSGVESTEREWSIKASRPGDEYIIPLLNQYRASWALIRQWTGHDPAVAEREAHIQRLERLVWDAVYALQKAGLDNEAAKLRRVLEKH